MPNVIVNCTFNPPSVGIMGAQLRQETLTALEKALPSCTTTSQCSMSTANGMAPKFSAANYPPHTWHMPLGQHYCDQQGRSVVFSAIIGALAAEGWELRTTNATCTDERDVTRLFFWRQTVSA